MKPSFARFSVLACALAGGFAALGDDLVEFVPWIKATRQQAVQTDWTPPKKNQIWLKLKVSMSGDYDSNGGGNVFLGETDSNQNAYRSCFKFYFNGQRYIRGDTRYEYGLTGGKNAGITITDENLRNYAAFDFWPTVFRWMSATQSQQSNPDDHSVSAGIWPIAICGETKYDGTVAPFTCYDMFFYGLTISENSETNVVRTYKPAKRGKVYGIWSTNHVSGATAFLASCTGTAFEGPGAETIAIDGTNYVYLVKTSYAKEAFATSGDAAAACWSNHEPISSTNHYVVADNLTLYATSASSTFGGASFSIGSGVGNTGSSGFFHGGNGLTHTFPRLDCRRGTFRATGNNNCTYVAGPVYILSTEERPFNFTGTTAQDYYCGLILKGQIIGAKDSVFRLASATPDETRKCNFEFRLYRKTNQDSGSVHTMENFFGHMVIDGDRVRCFAFPRDTTSEKMAGNDPGEYTAKGLVIKNGGIFYLDEYRTWYNFKNRGIYCEEGDCYLGTRGGQGQGVNVPITGAGRLFPGGRTDADWSSRPHFFTTNVACSALVLSNSVHVICGENVAISDDTLIEMYSGIFTTPSKGLRKRMYYKGGTINLGTGNLTTHSEGNLSITRTANPDLGTFEFAPGSQIVATPVTVTLESTMMYTTEGDYVLLKIPTSVKAVTASDFSVSGYNVKVTTSGGMQYVSLGDPVGDNMVAYVAPAGESTPTSPYSTWATAANDIQSAIDAVNAGGTVRVKTGVYAPSSAISVNKRMVLTSDNGSGTIDPAGTILDGAGASTLVTVGSSASGTAIRGLTLRNGKSTADYTGSAMTVANLSGSPLLVDRCRFLSNVGAAANAPAVCCGKSYVTYCHATFRKCTFEGNSSSGSGAGFSALESNVTDSWGLRGKPFVELCDFNCNTSKCGAAYFYSASSVTGSTFRANVGTSGAGGMSSNGNGTILCTDNVFVGNTGTGGAPHGDCAVTRCVLAGNRCSTLITRNAYECVLTNNVVTGSMIGEWKVPSVRNTLIASNYVSGAILNFFGNNAYAGTRRFDNVTIANNYFGKHYNNTNAGRDLFRVSATNCIFYGNVIGQQQSVPTASNAPEYSGAYNVSDDQFVLDFTDADHRGTFDPRFVDPDRGNYRLSAYSHACDAGATLPWMTADAVDLEGNPRRVNPRGRATDDALPDLGALECVTRSIGLIIKIR